NGEYWATYGLIAGAGLVMALSQLLGGWTKWGWPRISLGVLLWAFVPAAIAVLWIVAFHQPHHGLGRNHIRRWSHDMGIGGFVTAFGASAGVPASGLGLLFGYTFDTTGPRARRAPTPGAEAAAQPPVAQRQTPPRETPAQRTPRREPVRTDSRSE